jgi:outer membrane protein
MKRILIAVMMVTLVVAFGATGALAMDIGKVGYVDLQRALNESEAGQASKTELEEFIKIRQSKIEGMAKNLRIMQEEVQKQAVMLSDEALQQKAEQVRKMEREVERLIADSNDELQKKQSMKEREILSEINTIVVDMGQKGGYALILPADLILYSIEDMDITQKVLDTLNVRMAAKKKEKAQKEQEKVEDKEAK